MIELKHDNLIFSFPDVHESAKLTINFQRTLRIPDNDKVYPLPPGLGTFPLVHVDDHKSNVQNSWIRHGGVILPMYQAEALWIYFLPSPVPDRYSSYPCAIKVSTGKIDAVTGADHATGLHRNPQDYVVVPGQPWLDGYCVKKGVIRQFVAMPLGEGYTAEEQITQKAEHGGLQIGVYPMKADVFEKRFPRVERDFESWAPQSAMMAMTVKRQSSEMGLAPGGKMKQEIYKDRFDLDDWDLKHSSRCFIHIANSLTWHEITGKYPPHQPPSANEYSQAGLPWFDYYDDNLKTLAGSSKLANLKSVQNLSQKKGQPIANPPLDIKSIFRISCGKVREGEF